MRSRLAGCHAETLRMFPGPAQGPTRWACCPLPGDQEARQEAQEEATHDRRGRLTLPSPLTSVDGQPGMPAGLNHKLSTEPFSGSVTALTSAFVSTGHRFSVVTSGAQRSKNALLRLLR
jgi:hypothetical protein